MKRKIGTGTAAIVIAMTILLALMIGLLPASKVSAWIPLDVGGLDINESGATIQGDKAAKKAIAQGFLTLRNKSGSSMNLGDPVIIDATAIEIVAVAAAADDMTIAESLSSEGGLYTVMVTSSTAETETLTGTLTGTNENGDAEAETVSLAAGEWQFKSSIYWKTITDVDLANLTNNVLVYAYSMNGMIAATSNVTSAIGFVTETIADNAEGEVACPGAAVLLATVTGPDVIPGDILSCAGSGTIDEDGTAPVGVALEPVITTTGENARVLIRWAND